MPNMQDQDKDPKKNGQEEPDKTGQNEPDEDDLDLIDEDDESDDEGDDLDDLEDEILEMKEEDLQNPEKQAKALEALNKAKNFIKQKKVWRKRALDAGYSQGEPNKKESSAPPAKKNQDSQPTDSNARTEFRLDHPELKGSAVDQIEKFAKANGMSLEQAYRQPLVKSFLERTQKKNETVDRSPTSQHRGTPTTPPKNWATANRSEIEQRRREIASRKLK